MSQHHIPDGLFHEVWQLYETGHSSDEILARLIKRGTDLDVAEAVMSKVKHMRTSKKRARGFYFFLAGGLTLVAAFMTTFLLYQTNSDTGIALYGLTSVGITLLFIGMVHYFS
ncbi:MAG: hypothetical protein R2809_02775 [Flavobacteriales bacterium]